MAFSELVVRGVALELDYVCTRHSFDIEHFDVGASFFFFLIPQETLRNNVRTDSLPASLRLPSLSLTSHPWMAVSSARSSVTRQTDKQATLHLDTAELCYKVPPSNSNFKSVAKIGSDRGVFCFITVTPRNWQSSHCFRKWGCCGAYIFKLSSNSLQEEWVMFKGKSF